MRIAPAPALVAASANTLEELFSNLQFSAKLFHGQAAALLRGTPLTPTWITSSVGDLRSLFRW